MAVNNDSSHGWQKVTYPKHRKSQQQINKAHQNGSIAGDGTGNVFRGIEEQSKDRRRRVVEAQKAADAADLTMHKAEARSTRHPLGDDSDDDEGSEEEKKKVVEEKKKKPKKEKKPKVIVAEAAAKIDPADLESFIAEVTVRDLALFRFNFAD